MADEEVLQGGVANAGAVVRVGDEVLRPANEHSSTIHALLRHVRDAGFDGASLPLGVSPDGRERLRFIPGQVPFPPFPEWSQTDRALASMATLLRRFHDATLGFEREGATWNGELADSNDGEVICHNDVCPENVVFRDGTARALLDFEFAAPGRRIFDVAGFAVVCVPLESPEDAARTGRANLDPFQRLRLVADSYELAAIRGELLLAIAERLDSGEVFVRRRVDAGDAAFQVMWNQMGGAARYERRRAWFHKNRQRLSDVLG